MPLPAATKGPCNDCPWRRNAAAGWLGPNTAEEWVMMAHGETVIACHQTIVETDEDGEGSWEDPRIKQCAGAAIFRANVCKLPRDPEVARAKPDHAAVFSNSGEFLEYHGA